MDKQQLIWGEADGYEASFTLAPGEYKLVVKIEVDNDCEDQTSRTVDFKVGIDLHVIPETAIATTMVSMFAAGLAYMGIKKRKTK